MNEHVPWPVNDAHRRDPRRGRRTMDLMGLTKDDLIDGIEEPAGAMTAMLDAKDAVNLLI